ncbi:hypothetical protein K1T71_005398 [Dendrolimus kikuchii]|uniref:Uncharacterized protein n=1 Tax=Dendrolimus kikuchii TaxID=765133 RepID=A0ACC1D3Z7_9NEOP|nr:hypothetical protein K1T71_005398 [Dendrolimus kikuchii]
MAPRDITKPTTKTTTPMPKKNVGRSLPTKIKKTIEKKPMKMNDSTSQRQSAVTAPKVPTPKSKISTPKKMTTPKAKENKPMLPPNSVTKSGKKSWQRRPKPAHSGVPVPEKMKKLLEKQFLIDFDNSF